MEKIDLSHTTFIIPVRLDSRDREFNLNAILIHLTKNLKTNIFIKESDDKSRVLDLIRNSFPETIGNIWIDYDGLIKGTIEDCTLTYIFEENKENIFHRTRLLNEMLWQVKTPVVVNYDCDVLFLPEAYKEAQDRILSGSDLVYPFANGISQIKVEVEDRPFLNDLRHLIAVAPEKNRTWQAQFGHAMFFNTQSYKDGGGENENYFSYGPEDICRGHRFQKLGYKVEWLNHWVFHIEHSRGFNSSTANPSFKANDDLYRELMYLTPEQTREYYTNAEYLKKYR